MKEQLQQDRFFHAASFHPLTNFLKWRYYQNEHLFNGVYSRNSLPKVEDEAYALDLDEYKLTRTH